MHNNKDMIYVYRTLWLIFYVPIFITEILLFAVSIPLFIIGSIIYFIKTGDIENTPDIFVPFKMSIMLDYWYKDLLEKI